MKAREEDYDWAVIKSNTNKMIIINSANDPWRCNDVEGKKIFDRTGGLLIINNDGHMGSSFFKQPYKEFPLLVKLID